MINPSTSGRGRIRQVRPIQAGAELWQPSPSTAPACVPDPRPLSHCAAASSPRTPKHVSLEPLGIPRLSFCCLSSALPSRTVPIPSRPAHSPTTCPFGPPPSRPGRPRALRALPPCVGRSCIRSLGATWQTLQPVLARLAPKRAACWPPGGAMGSRAGGFLAQPGAMFHVKQAQTERFCPLRRILTVEPHSLMARQRRIDGSGHPDDRESRRIRACCPTLRAIWITEVASCLRGKLRATGHSTQRVDANQRNVSRETRCLPRPHRSLRGNIAIGIHANHVHPHGHGHDVSRETHPVHSPAVGRSRVGERRHHGGNGGIHANRQRSPGRSCCDRDFDG